MAVPAVEGLGGLSEADLRLFRDRVEALGYRPELLAEAEGVAPGQLDAVALPLVRWELTQRGDAAGRLGLLFSYGDAVAAEVLDGDLGANMVVALSRAGLLVAKPNGTFVCPFRLLPVEGLLLLGDEPSAGPDAVMGPGPTTLELASQLPRGCSGSALDVGSGAGTLALLLAARGASPVVGTDVNPRATAMATFNARLNGLTAEFVTGDLDEPVRGQRFAWVVSQPAYVLRPEGTAAVTFLHGGRRGDELAFRLLGRLPGLLEREGTALLLFDTPVESGRPLSARVRHAVGEAAVDVAVLTAPALAAGAQAVGYASLEVPELGQRYAEAVWRYRSHLAALGVTEWSHALVALRTDGEVPAGGRYTVQLPVKRLSQGGPEALVTLLGALHVASLPDQALLELPVRLQPRACLVDERTTLAAQPSHRVVFQGGSFGMDQELTDAGLGVLEALQSAQDVAGAVSRYAQLCDAEPAEVQEQVLDFVRAGLGRGLLVPHS
jgi:SAM-dependent methyltransferase